MADKAGGYQGGVEAALADFIGLLGKAILSGIAASVVLALITLGLATTAGAQETPSDISARRGTEPRSVAPTTSPSGEHSGVGALWAMERNAGPKEERRPGGDRRTALVKTSLPSAAVPAPLPQTDTASTLQILLGLLALGAAAMVALIGRCVAAAGADSPEGTR